MLGGMVIVPQIRTEEENKEVAHDLAWAHSTSFAALRGDEVGSDDFLEYYQSYLGRYQLCTDHIGFLQNMALRTTRELLNLGMALMIPKSAEQDDVIDAIQSMAEVLVSSFMWIMSCYPEDWVPNEEWEDLPLELRGVQFPDVTAARLIAKENDEHHD